MVVGFEAQPDGDPRDAWLPVAFEETLTWRLRRLPRLCVVPTIRVYQARQELEDPNSPPPWPQVAQGLGATHLLSGLCRGSANAVELELCLRPPGEPEAAPERVTLPRGRLFDVLDEATRWVLARLGSAKLEDSLASRIFAPPSTSPSAVEYYARAVSATRRQESRDALRYATESVLSDKVYRPALGLLAQLELRAGPAGRKAAAVRLRSISELARAAGDQLDRGSAELAQSLLAQTEGASEAAYTRAETALTIAYELDDVYGQVAALGWITDLYVTWQPPAGIPLSPEARGRFERENLKRAAQWQRVLVEMLESLGDEIGLLSATSKLALLCERLGESDAAFEMAQRTLSIARGLHARRHEATAWLYVGQWYAVRERWPEATDALNRCLELADDASKPAARLALGGLYQAMSEPSKALAEFDRALEQVRAANDLATQIICLREIGRTQMRLDRRQAAIEALEEAIDIAHALELPDESALRAELATLKDEKP